MCGKSKYRKGGNSSNPGEVQVVLDLGPDTPVSEDELLVIEAFLRDELAAILENGPARKTKAPSGGAKAKNSCHSADSAYGRELKRAIG